MCCLKSFNTNKLYLHYTSHLKVAKLVSYILIHVHFSNVKPTEDRDIYVVFKIRDNLFHKMT